MLFSVDISKRTTSSIPIIEGSKRIIYFDELPMLYSGVNGMGVNILGSLIAEDVKANIYRYLHLALTSNDLLLFITQKISYRELIIKQNSVFLIEKNFNDELLHVYDVHSSTIPENYLPVDGFYCPDVDLVFGSLISCRLKGIYADYHEAYANTAAVITRHFAKFLQHITDAVQIKNVNPLVMRVPETPSSFGINFRVKFKSDDALFELVQDQLHGFVANVVKYSFNHLNGEVTKLKSNTFSESNYESQIENELKEIYNSMGVIYTEKVGEKAVSSILKIPLELEKISNELGNGFENIEIRISDDDSSLPVGKIDTAFSEELETASLLIHDATAYTDSDYIEYHIHIYHLNKESRRGNAHYIRKDGDDQIIDSPFIKIEGDGSLEGSIFMESMDKGKTIKVRAIGKMVNEKVRSLKIQFPQE